MPVDDVAGLDGSSSYDDPGVCGPVACPSNTENLTRRSGVPNYLGITKFEYAVTSPSGGPTLVEPWTEVPFQGGPGQTPHPFGVRSEWGGIGRPAPHTRLAVNGTPGADLAPIDTYLADRMANGHVYEVRQH